jgi:hypothetical protein
MLNITPLDMAGLAQVSVFTENRKEVVQIAILTIWARKLI